MYYSSRAEAGQILAKQLERFAEDDAVVLALSEGGVVVGAQVAAKLRCPLMFLLTEDITLPGELTALGVVDQSGGFIYNDHFSTGELDALAGEYHGVIEQLKMQKWQSINRLLSGGGMIDTDILKDRVVIIISDGFLNGVSLLATMNFLKPVTVKRVVIATPYASVSAVDKMHVLGDELEVLHVIDGTFDLDHYYEVDDIPHQKDIIETLNQAIQKWK